MPTAKECLLTSVSNAAVCMVAIAEQLRGTGGEIPPECAQFVLDMGDPSDGVATITLTVPAKPQE